MGADVPPENINIEYNPIVTVQSLNIRIDKDIGKVIYKTRAKFYRFDNILKEWKERDSCDAKFLKIHFVMRRETNHLFWSFFGVDGELSTKILAIRFSTAEKTLGPTLVQTESVPAESTDEKQREVIVVDQAEEKIKSVAVVPKDTNAEITGQLVSITLAKS